MGKNFLRYTPRALPKTFLPILGVALMVVSPLAQAQTPATPTPDSPAPAAATASAASLINSMDALNDHTVLNNGDLVSYRVVEEQKDSVPRVITVTGEIDVPLLGRYPAAGKTCKQLATELKPLLEKDYFYKATVIIGLDDLSTRTRGKVYLMGQVRSQGAIELPPNEDLTLSKAVLLNGGLADFADRRRVKLLRKKADGTTETTTVDLVEILDKGHSEKDPVLQPGDTINVPEKLINF